ncbi:MAG: DUF2997 domain-containing protein [Candidatus Manganitrophaceae bacterium]
MKKIEITFDPQGEVRLITEGFAGKECREASRFLEEALGSVVGETLTGEYFQVQTKEQLQQKRE